MHYGYGSNTPFDAFAAMLWLISALAGAGVGFFVSVILVAFGFTGFVTLLPIAVGAGICFTLSAMFVR